MAGRSSFDVDRLPKRPRYGWEWTTAVDDTDPQIDIFKSRSKVGKRTITLSERDWMSTQVDRNSGAVAACARNASEKALNSIHMRRPRISAAVWGLVDTA